MGTAQNIYLYNNVFSNQATQIGAGNSAVMTINGTSAQYFGNYNVFYNIESNPIVNLGATNYTLAAWKSASANDTSSTNAAVPFISNNDLHINTTDPAAWNVFGRGLATPLLVTDKDGNVRSTTTGTPTTAGAFEIAAPTAVPADMIMIPATPVIGTPTEFWSNGRKIAEINWVAGATMPTTFSAKFYPGVPAPALNYTPNTNAYFEVTEAGFSGSYTIKQYVNAAEGAGQPYANLRGAKRHNTNPYTFISTAGNNSMDANGNYLLSNPQTSFSTFGMTSGSIPLNIVLKDISAMNEAKDNRINWTSVSEQEGDVFELQSSADGKSFMAIATIKALGQPGNYDYLDKDAATGITYYRLKVNTANGSSEYSKIVSAKVSINNAMSITIVPNPTSDVIHIQNNFTSDSHLLIELRDITGRIIKSVKTNNNTTTIDMKDLPAGTYIVRVYDGQSVFVSKVIKH